jgi:Polyketide cyclase / dehydrase and lipid transport
MQIDIETTIDAAPADVFAIAADIGHWPDVISAIESIELLTPGAVGIGTRFRETRKMFGKSATEEMTVAEFAPPHRFVLTAHSHGTAYRTVHTLEPVGAGTRLRVLFEVTPTSLLARIMAPVGWLLLGTLKRQIAADLADMKRAAERRPHT